MFLTANPRKLGHGFRRIGCYRVPYLKGIGKVGNMGLGGLGATVYFPFRQWANHVPTFWLLLYG